MPSSATPPCTSRPQYRSMYLLSFIHFWSGCSPEAASTALRIGQTPRRPDQSGSGTLGTITRPQVVVKSDGTRTRPAHTRSWNDCFRELPAAHLNTPVPWQANRRRRARAAAMPGRHALPRQVRSRNYLYSRVQRTANTGAGSHIPSDDR